VAEPTTVAPESSSDKVTRKAREKVRPLNVLIDAPVKSLSDKEKTLLIEHYKLETNKLTQQVASYRNNAEAAFEKAQLFERSYANAAQQTTAKFNDIIQAVSMLYKTVHLIAKDGMNND
jgi:hypothetical protein